MFIITRTRGVRACVEALRSAPIEGPHPYLYLDATFLDARWARKVENVSALVAYAVDPDGLPHSGADFEDAELNRVEVRLRPLGAVHADMFDRVQQHVCGAV